MRQAKDTDFFVELPGVGVFRFGRRTYGDRARIRAEYLRYIGSINADDTQNKLVEFFADVSANPPKGWDQVKDDIYERILKTNGIDAQLYSYAAIISAHKVLCVQSPEGWEDLETLDVLIGDNENKVFELYDLLRQKEDTFRSGAREGSSAPRQDAQ